MATAVTYITTSRRLGLSGLILLVTAGTAAAQEVGGLNVTFDLGQRFENREESGFSGLDNSGFRSLTTLAFGLSSETRSQSLALGLSSGLAATFDDDSDAEFEGTLATLDYARNSRNTALTFGTRYRRDAIDDLVFDATLTDDDVVTGVGQREVLTFSSGLVLGRAARVTGTFNHSYEASRFFDTLDPTLNDSDTQMLDGRVSFQLTRTITADLFASHSEVDERGAGATDRDRDRIGTGLSYIIDQATTLAAEVAYSETESRGDTVESSDGLGYVLSLVRDRPAGPVNVSYTQTEALTGTRRQLTAGQDMTLKRGALGFALGISETDGFDPQLLANLSFDYELDRNSTTRISLSQEGTINGDDEEVVNSRLDLSYARNLTSLSQLGASLAIVDENVLAAGTADQRAITFDLTYDYALTADWGLTSGYQYSSVRLDGEPDRDRTTVFVGLQRRFAYRP